MYVSPLTFHTTPGKTHEVEQELLKLMAMVSRAGGVQPRVFAATWPLLVHQTWSSSRKLQI